MIVKVGATKGGIGKTTVALNLALGRALAAEMSGSSIAIIKELPKLVTHDRSSFDSGSVPLNRYLREQATQDVRRRRP